MTDLDGPARPDPAHYPDVAAAGDLRTALQAAFDAACARLRAGHVSAPGWRWTDARVHTGDRHANLGMASNDRLFLLDCWMHGVHMAKGKTRDLSEAAAAISTFLAGVAVRELAATWPFVSTWRFAEAFERGEPDAIACRWERYLQRPPARARHMLDLYEFLTAAGREPRLRALFPFTSYRDLGFRRSVPDLQSRALAWVRPFGAGHYLIAGPDRRQLYWPGPVRKTLWDDEPLPGALGPADAQDTVTLVLARLDSQPQL